jgi:hypothetical protein
VKDDTKTLKELKVVKNSKMMLVGTTMSDLVAVTTKPSSAEIAANTSTVSKKEALSKQKVCSHRVSRMSTFPNSEDFS